MEGRISAGLAFTSCIGNIIRMREVNLVGIDLNLLVAFEALLDERSVTRAAERVGLSQPAMSRALGRLRALFGDRLFVRTTAGLAATPRAEAAAVPLRALLAEVRRLVQPPDFDPAAMRGTVRLAMVDYQSVLLLPRLLARLERDAPGLDVQVVAMGPDLHARLESGDVDLSIGVFDRAEAGLYRQTLYRDGFACLVRAGHPCLHGPLGVERFAALRHAFLTTTGEGRGGMVDGALQRLGLSRRITLFTPHFLAAPLMVAESDLILTLPRMLAQRLQRMAPVVVLEPPVDLPVFTVSQLWHERRHGDPAHAWLRAALASAAADLAPLPPSPT